MSDAHAMRQVMPCVLMLGLGVQANDNAIESAMLCDGSMTCGAVQYQQRLMWGPSETLADGSFALGELIHELRIGMQAATGVAHHHLIIFLDCLHTR